VLGLQGMPRRVYTYPAEMEWGSLNFLSTVGAFMIAVSVLLFIVNVLRSRRHGAPAGNDPWGAGTLEWSVPSPPPAANYDRVPVVHARDPLWEPPGLPSHVTGLANDYREILVTSVADAAPDHRLWLPASSLAPFATAVATTILFVGSIFTPWAVVWAAVPVAMGATWWFWPKKDIVEQRTGSEISPLEVES